MDQNIIIAITVIAGVAIMVIAKMVLHTFVKFKMDESAILNLIKQGNGEQTFLNNHEISNKLNMKVTRVSEVCAKSTSINENTSQKDSWCLK